MTQVKSFQLRLFKAEDLDHVIKINLTCLPENYSPFFYLDLHEHYPRTFLVAEADGQIVGYVMCRIELGFSEFRRIEFAKKGHVVSIAVMPDYRRQGIAKTLMIEAMKGMETYNATECFLEVRVTNQPAINLYKKLGFQIIRIIKAYYHDGEDAYEMCRKLPYKESENCD
ncbi:MAG: ribosomal protein S18-alanine N-acetyltransferase [Candidatus Bathyarchaeia archaeon]